MASSSTFAVACLMMAVVHMTNGLLLDTILNPLTKCQGNPSKSNKAMCELACKCKTGQQSNLCVTCCQGLVGPLAACTILANMPLMNDLNSILNNGDVQQCHPDSGLDVFTISHDICDCCYSEASGQRPHCETVGVPENHFWTEFGLVCGNL